eukprot:GHVS01032507.1.p1 GENE.GHVS01032507.1~~GHVS01032507.1.p1  ORF type:complete len:133 (-),score=20.80 GHVS01032507.1:64-462(-)
MCGERDTTMCLEKEKHTQPQNHHHTYMCIVPTPPPPPKHAHILYAAVGLWLPSRLCAALLCALLLLLSLSLRDLCHYITGAQNKDYSRTHTPHAQIPPSSAHTKRSTHLRKQHKHANTYNIYTEAPMSYIYI